MGAGPGGLTAGMILAKRGYQVEIFEKTDRTGGRNAAFELDGYKFDIGPTFLMMRHVLDEVFELAGFHSEEELEFIELKPMYDLFFPDQHLSITNDPKKMEREIAKIEPNDAPGYMRLMKREKNDLKDSHLYLQGTTITGRTLPRPIFYELFLISALVKVYSIFLVTIFTMTK